MRHKFALAVMAICGACLSMGVNISLAQVHSVQIFIVYYNGLPNEPNDRLFDGYSIFVNEPRVNNNIRDILGVRRDLTVFHYLDMTELGPSLPYREDVLEHHQDFLLKTIGGELNGNLPLRAKYAWGFERPYDSTGRYGNSFYLDPGSRGWASYYAALADSTLILPDAQGREGIFVDDVGPAICGGFSSVPRNLQIDINGDGRMDREDDSAWVNNIIEFSKRIRSRLGSDVPLIANMGNWPSWAENTGLRILALSDFGGAMNESFIHASLSYDSSAYPTLSAWKANIDVMIIADSLGKILLCQSLGYENDTQARLFCLGSFLLGANGRTYFNYRYHSSYDTLYHFPEFFLPLGNPRETFANIDQAFDVSWGVYRRSFDSVEVLVNPLNHDVTFNLPSPRKVLTLIGGIQEKGGHFGWETQQQFDMKPHAAVILSNN
jgi:hypothetical protein